MLKEMSDHAIRAAYSHDCSAAGCKKQLCVGTKEARERASCESNLQADRPLLS